MNRRDNPTGGMATQYGIAARSTARETRQLACSMLTWRPLWTALALATLALGFPVATWAHGGGTPQLAGAEAGPYRLYAWTTPDPWRTGEVHVDIAVAMPVGDGAEMPVADAEVEVHLAHAASEQTLTLAATPLELLNSFYYETDFELPAAGVWQVDIQVQSEQGVGSAGFTIEALPPRQVNWLLIGAAAGTLAVAGALWAIWARQSPTALPPGPNRTRRQPGTSRAHQPETEN